MKTLSLLSGSVRAAARGATALLLLVALPVACDDEASVRSAGGTLEPGDGEDVQEPGEEAEPNTPPGDGQTASNGGSGNQGTGGSAAQPGGGSSGETSAGGSGGTDPAPQCLTFDDAERVPLYDGTTLPPLN